ncbi:MAG: NADH-quinone oxidoreductase subunit I, partial [candidate division KSB1 bacterium]|nr:NADH-quinone oxidoreductase subunit I [candidate division KSB1 bacterium]
MKPDQKLPLRQRIYLYELIRGLAITIRHLVKNVVHRSQMVTVEYPDERREYSPRFRGRHRLKKRDDGSPRCVACMLCATICPAQCITIEATEHPDPEIQKQPIRWELDILRCVFCGLCVEACPKDAIEMTGVYELSDFSRQALVYDMNYLLNP